ncbi:hypothetical protein FRC18_004031 [Serendipita sp. 400]|nr:hypothetical protein FRC18_004031 [Serendipita sp. 400]
MPFLFFVNPLSTQLRLMRLEPRASALAADKPQFSRAKLLSHWSRNMTTSSWLHANLIPFLYKINCRIWLDLVEIMGTISNSACVGTLSTEEFAKVNGNKNSQGDIGVAKFDSSSPL